MEGYFKKNTLFQNTASSVICLSLTPAEALEAQEQAGPSVKGRQHHQQ